MVEPYELRGPERTGFWEDVLAAAEGLAREFAPIKMNYEIHGNTLPHLHVHLFPRRPDDPFVGGPIDPRRPGVERDPAQITRIARAVSGR